MKCPYQELEKKLKAEIEHMGKFTVGDFQQGKIEGLKLALQELTGETLVYYRLSKEKP